MKKCFYLLGLIAFGFNAAVCGEENKVTYYVQLIRGDDNDTPPVTEGKRIGPKLAKELNRIFRWKSYWEIKHRQVEVANGQKTRVQLNKEREVEIDLTGAGKRKVTAYRNGRPVCSALRPVGQALTVIGG